jgi:putative MATE family efflux protein
MTQALRLDALVPAAQPPLWRKMLLFLVLQTAGAALQLISGTITSIYVGKLIGVAALAAASAFFPIFFLLVSFLIGLVSGGIVLVGQAHGAGDRAQIKAIAGTALSVNALLSLTIAVAGCALSESILVLLGTPPDILVPATEYARVTFAVLPAMVIFFTAVNLLRGTGDARTPLWAMALSIAVSLLLMPALIQGWLGLPALGLLSAPVSSFVASVVSLAALGVDLRRRGHPMAPDRALVAALRIDRRIAMPLVRIGVPSGLQVATVSLSEVAVICFINPFGSSATAAYGIVNQVVSYVQAPSQGASVAAAVFGAQAIGAGAPLRLGEVTRVAVLLNLIVSGVIIGIVYLFLGDILSWFVIDSAAQSIASRALMVTLWSYLAAGVTGVLAGVMRSSGVVLWPTGILIAAIWLVEIPTAYWLSRSIGLDGVWIGYPAAFVAAFLAQLAYYALVWRRRRHRPLVERSSC